MYTDEQVTHSLADNYRSRMMARMTNYNPESSANYDFGKDFITSAYLPFDHLFISTSNRRNNEAIERYRK
jgi:hypothetical protein